MKPSKTANSCGKAVKKQRGKPFAKGPDSRRNSAGGNRNHEAQSYTIRFANALAKKLDPEEFADIVIDEVRHHRPGAREFYADRLMGKISQPLEHSGPDGGPMVMIMSRPGKKE
jgi:hypothetical protein